MYRVTFEWDPKKSDENFARRGFDFEFAALVFASTYVEFDDTRRDYGERRVIAFGVADGIPRSVVFTDRSARSFVASSVSAAANARSVVAMPKPSKPASRHPTPTPTRGRADLAQLWRMSDAEIARTSPTALRHIPDDFWQEVRVVTPVSKQAISIRLDTDVIAWFRTTGPRYQTRINAVLRSYVEQVAASPKPVRKSSAG